MLARKELWVEKIGNIVIGDVRSFVGFVVLRIGNDLARHAEAKFMQGPLMTGHGFSPVEFQLCTRSAIEERWSIARRHAA